MSEVLRSLWIYVPRLVRQWWASIGLLFGLAGFGLQVAGLLRPPSVFWLSVAVLTVAIAAFQLFHRDRLAASERAVELGGPALPYWVGIGLRGHRDATYLAVIGCSQDPKTARPSTTDFPKLDSELVEVLGIAGKSLERRSFNSGFETTLYGPQQASLRRVKVDITAAVFLQVEWRLDTEPVDLAVVLIQAVDGVRAMRRGACASALGRRPWIGVALIQWPAVGISTEGVLKVQRWSDGQHLGQSIDSFSRPARHDSDWSIVLAFAEKLLSDAGYIDFEPALRSVTEDQAREVLRSRHQPIADAAPFSDRKD